LQNNVDEYVYSAFFSTECSKIGSAVELRWR